MFKSLIYVVSIVSLILMSPAPQKAENVELTQRDVAKLITEYVADDTDGKRRQEIVGKLKTAKPMLATKSLAALVKDEQKRACALTLAIDLKVPGLFTEAKKYVDTVDEDLIIKLMFTTQDDGAAAFLFERWKKLEVGEPSFAYVNTGFLEYPADLAAVIESFKSVIDNKTAAKRTHAAKILKYQLALETEDPDEFHKLWPTVRADYARDSRNFAVTGTDMLSLQGWDVTTARKVRNNYRLSKDRTMKLGTIPEELQQGDFTLKMQVLVANGDGQIIAIGVSDGSWEVRQQKCQWELGVQGGAKYCTPAKAGEWVEFIFSVTDRSTETRKLSRTFQLTIGGKKMFDSGGDLSGTIKHLTLSAGEGTLVIGGVEYCKTAAKK